MKIVIRRQQCALFSKISQGQRRFIIQCSRNASPKLFAAAYDRARCPFQLHAPPCFQPIGTTRAPVNAGEDQPLAACQLKTPRPLSLETVTYHGFGASACNSPEQPLGVGSLRSTRRQAVAGCDVTDRTDSQLKALWQMPATIIWWNQDAA